ncbi:hypothetical protein [Ammoniphilus sp. CFH 90114]|uniref:hypothetical protein n=1 Tax=Ammoniphilus sp. CFH 90114 TaxID=2493665 RepID=UPI00100F2BE7|nr:hypothetical protein [Ammoniphilus sp. CFH 90114]RXT07064.1 hypothetical protein EIZ39_13005 [Ammoniphilus sp. CFH 90114]
MFIPSGKRVKVNIWEKGIVFLGKVKQWNTEEVVIHQEITQKVWKFAYLEILKGKVKISIYSNS